MLSLKEMRQSGVVVQQWDFSCAAAALTTVLRYQHGIATDEKSVAEAMLRRTDPLRVRVRGGFSLLDLKRHVETRGLKGLGYTELATDDLVAMAPLIIPVDFTGFPHFVVFRGMVGDQALLADPAFGNRLVDIDALRKHWLGSIGFVVAGSDGTPLPPGRLAVNDHAVAAVPAIATREAVRLR